MALPNKNDKVYNTKKLSKFFAISSILLLISLVWAVLEDYDRPWKKYFRQNQKIQEVIGTVRLSAAQKAIDQSKLSSLEKQRDQVHEQMKEITKEVDERISKLEAIHYKKNQVFQFENAQFSALEFDLNTALYKQKPKAQKLKQKHAALRTKVEKLRDEAYVAEQNLEAARETRKDILSKESSLSASLTAMNAEIEKQQKIITANEASILNIARNAPLVDFVVPTVKIQQVVLPDLFVNYHFNKVPRVDRCMTCHATIDKKGFEDFPQPFTSHPNLELFLASDTKHPMSKVGCTVCHSGQGHSVDFSLAGHSPKNKKQEEVWKQKYAFYRDHHLETPMLPTSMTEGRCIQCHAQQTNLEGAPNLNAGMDIIERVGCWGCHKVKGHFEELYKTSKKGPSLKKVASKVSRDWAAKWLWDPKSYNPSTTMPAFYKVHNNSDKASLARSAVEVDAIINYLFDKSQSYAPLDYPSNLQADVNKGKELVGTVGCLGCHASNDFVRVNPKKGEVGHRDERVPMFGPELNQIGSKVTKEWLYSWLKAPRHYWPGTKMPDMRLTEQEAVDVAAYLLTKRNLAFEQSPLPKASEKVRDQVLMQYFSKKMSLDSAGEKIAAMSVKDKRDWLGEKMITHLGCAGCHAIAGHENDAQIGAELTYEGSKDISKFAFDHVHVEHTRHDWILAKVRTPRIFDIGMRRDYDSKTRMPHFGFDRKQAEAVATVVVGWQKNEVAKEAIFPVDGRMEKVIAGHKELRQKNCLGCHVVENRGGEILAHYQDDPSSGPPNLNWQGAKTKGPWLYSFFKKPEMIRPWLNVRMPSFHMNEEQSATLIDYFAAYDKIHHTQYSSGYKVLTADERRQAEGLITEQGCLSCHAVRKPGEEVEAAAPHFTTVAKRLKPGFVTEWLKRPDQIMPGTRMPALWPLEDDSDPNSKRIALPGYFNDDAEKQIEAVKDYLYQYSNKDEARIQSR